MALVLPCCGGRCLHLTGAVCPLVVSRWHPALGSLRRMRWQRTHVTLGALAGQPLPTWFTLRDHRGYELDYFVNRIAGMIRGRSSRV